MSIKFTKRDQNRFRRVYSFKRNEPRFTLAGGEGNDIVYEAGKITFTSADLVLYTFTETFPSAPSVVATAVDSVGNSEANVNVYIESLTQSSMLVRTSTAFTGEVHFHAAVELA